MLNNIISFDNYMKIKPAISYHKKRLSSYKILVIEPEKCFQSIHLFFLKKIGFTHIDIVSCGNEANNLIKTNLYNLIMLEVNLSDCTGISFCKKLNKIKKYNLSKVLFATSYTKSAIEDICLSHGISDVITKPFFFNEYSQIVKKYI